MHYLVKSLSTETNIVQLLHIKIDGKRYILGKKTSSIELFDLTTNGDLISVMEQMLYNDLVFLGALGTTQSSDVLVILTQTSLDFMIWSTYLRRFILLNSIPLVSSVNRKREQLPFKFAISDDNQYLAYPLANQRLIAVFHIRINTISSSISSISLEKSTQLDFPLIWDFQFLKTPSAHGTLQIVLATVREDKAGFSIITYEQSKGKSSLDITSAPIALLIVPNTSFGICICVQEILLVDLINMNVLCVSEIKTLVTDFYWCSPNQLLTVDESGCVAFYTITEENTMVKSQFDTKVSGPVSACIVEQGFLVCMGDFVNGGVYKIGKIDIEKRQEIANQCSAIREFQVGDFFDEQQDQIIAISKLRNKQSLQHTIRNGLAVSRIESDPMNVSGITGVWALKRNTSNKIHSFIVMSFLSGSCVFEMSSSGEIEDVTNATALITNESTLYCGNIGNSIVQVTPTHMYLYSIEKRLLLNQWEAPGNSIVQACGYGDMVLLGLNNPRQIVLFQLEGSKQPKNLYTIPVESLQLSSIQLSTTNSMRYIVFGTYTSDLTIVTLSENFTLVKQQTLSLSSIAHSIQCLLIDSKPFISIGHRDGTVSIFGDVEGSFVMIASRAVGTIPVSLLHVSDSLDGALLALSNRPTYIEKSGNRFNFKTVTFNQVTYACPFSIPDSYNSLIFISQDNLSIVNIQTSNKLNVQSITNTWNKFYFDSITKRTIYSETNNTLGISPSAQIDQIEKNFVVSTITVWKYSSTEHFVVVVGYNEQANLSGLYLFKWSDNGSLVLTITNKCEGKVSTVHVYQEKNLLVGVNTSLFALAIQENKASLGLVASWKCSSPIVSISSYLTRILVSVQPGFCYMLALRLNAFEMILRTRFQLLNGQCILLSDESGISIDKDGSLTLFHAELKENSEDEYVQSHESFNLGDIPCGIQRGSLNYIAKQNKIESFIIPTFSGKVYCVEAVKEKKIGNMFVKLLDFMLLNPQVKLLGCKNQESKNIINGDILALFLELPTALQLEILQNQFSLRDVIETLENKVK